MSATELVVWGIVAHLICDWLLQNHWMAINKADLRHPGAWVHGGIHAVGAALVFPWYIAMLLGLAHVLLDTRKPMIWWRATMKQTVDGPYALSVALWGDQVAHLALIAWAALVA